MDNSTARFFGPHAEVSSDHQKTNRRFDRQAYHPRAASANDRLHARALAHEAVRGNHASREDGGRGTAGDIAHAMPIPAIDESIDRRAGRRRGGRCLTDLDLLRRVEPVSSSRADRRSVPGEPIVMRARAAVVAQPQTETVFEHRSGRRFSYGVDLWARSP